MAVGLSPDVAKTLRLILEDERMDASNGGFYRLPQIFVLLTQNRRRGISSEISAIENVFCYNFYFLYLCLTYILCIIVRKNML